MDKMLSIIVPVYNEESKGNLRFCLDSILNQVFQDFELIIVDDSSTDNSYEVAKKYENEYPNKIKVVKTKFNMKLGAARNLGMSIANGKYIGFVDSDDFIDKYMYEKMIKKAEETGADRVLCDHYATYEQSFEPGYHIFKVMEDRIIGRLSDEDLKRNIVGITSSIWCSIFLNSVIKDNSLIFAENMYYEDLAVDSNWVSSFRNVEVVHEPLYYYHLNKNSIMQNFDIKSANDMILASRLIKLFAIKKGIYEKYKEEIEYNSFVILCGDTIRSTLYSNKLSIAEKSSIYKNICNIYKKEHKNIVNNIYYKNRFAKTKKKILKMIEINPKLFSLITAPMCKARYYAKKYMPYDLFIKLRNMVDKK